MKRLLVIMMAALLMGTMMVPGIAGTAAAQTYLSVGDLKAGDLIITEIMQNPDIVSDANGEWFEIYNASGVDVDLENLLVIDEGTDDFIVTGTLIVDSGDYVVFGINDDTGSNGGVPVNYIYSGFTLANGDDEIILVYGYMEGTTAIIDKVIDQVSYDGGPSFPDPTGASMTLHPTKFSATANNTGTNWCEATSPYGKGDYGTPGAPNDSCVLAGEPPLSTGPILVSGGSTFTVKLDSLSVAVATRRQIWTYTITQSGTPTLSHWTLGIDCNPAVETDTDELWDYIIASNPPISETGKDGNTGIWGIKWETSDPSEANGWAEDGDVWSKQFSFTMDRAYHATTVPALVKAGSHDNTSTGDIIGPDCTSDDPSGPVPELPTIILMSLGLLGLGGYIVIKRRRARTAAII